MLYGEKARSLGKYGALFLYLYFLLVYIYTQDTVPKPSHLGIALIMKDKRSKIKTNEQMIQEMMMLQYCISLHILMSLSQ